MDIAAILLGANMIEKTITEDRTIRSCEHSFSLEEHQINDFIVSIRNLETALGVNRRIIPSFVQDKEKQQESPYALKNLKKGSIIQLKDFDMRRPGNGLNFADFSSFNGLELKREIMEGELLTKNHFE